jgi:hypothetical protein
VPARLSNQTTCVCCMLSSSAWSAAEGLPACIVIAAAHKLGSVVSLPHLQCGSCQPKGWPVKHWVSLLSVYRFRGGDVAIPPATSMHVTELSLTRQCSRIS